MTKNGQATAALAVGGRRDLESRHFEQQSLPRVVQIFDHNNRHVT